MDGLLSIIIFFIISSIFSIKKNNKRKMSNSSDGKNRESKNELQWLEDIWTDIKSGQLKDPLSNENLNDSQMNQTEEIHKLSQQNKLYSNNKNRKQMKTEVYKSKEQTNELINQSKENVEIGFNDEFMISREELPKFNNRHSVTSDFLVTKKDLKRAIILKEIFDRPLSLRTQRRN